MDRGCGPIASLLGLIVLALLAKGADDKLRRILASGVVSSAIIAAISTVPMRLAELARTSLSTPYRGSAGTFDASEGRSARATHAARSCAAPAPPRGGRLPRARSGLGRRSTRFG